MTLRKTDCDNYCNFNKITTFCFDCPALLCDKCNNLLHSNQNHKKITFKNENLNWNDRNIISGILDDRNLIDNVYAEVSRNISFKKPMKPLPTIKPLDSTDSRNRWKCEQCTYENNVTDKKCAMCFIFRKVTSNDNQLEYDSKIRKFHKEMLGNFNELDRITLNNPNIPIENIIYCFSNSGSSNLMNWYRVQYPGTHGFNIINEILDKNKYNMSLEEIKRGYNECVVLRNNKLLDKCPNQGIIANLRNRQEVVETRDINALNKIPEKIMLKMKKMGESARKDIVNQMDVWAILSGKEALTNRQKRMLMTEMDLKSKTQLDTLTNYLQDIVLGAYLKESFPSGYVTLIHLKQVVSDNFSIEQALNFLKKPCEVCCGDYPIPEMRELITCGHTFCKQCIFQWLEDLVQTKYPCKWMCPNCDESKYALIDRNMYYGQLREFLIKDKTLLDLFETKLLQERLMDSPNFHWCANEACTNGFEAEGLNKIQCPSCKQYMCVNCNRKWQDEHENKSCEEFAMWMLRNDPNLSNLLKNIGIECPKCGMRYALAAGGCLHFNCKACGTQFCGGCDQIFVDRCGKPGCEMTNFHSHHPRNCLYFLRDHTTAELENMLANSDYPKLVNKPEKACQYMITTDKLVDVACGKAVFGTTGMCEVHYKEYLVQFINRFKIDPADFGDCQGLNMMLFQMVLPRLEKQKNEKEDAFKLRLITEVKAKCLFYIPKGIQEEKPAEN